MIAIATMCTGMNIMKSWGIQMIHLDFWF